MCLHKSWAAINQLTSMPLYTMVLCCDLNIFKIKSLTKRHFDISKLCSDNPYFHNFSSLHKSLFLKCWPCEFRFLVRSGWVAFYKVIYFLDTATNICVKLFNTEHFTMYVWLLLKIVHWVLIVVYLLVILTYANFVNRGHELQSISVK